MSNSKLVDYVRISPKRTSPRNHKIDKITIHHMAGNLTVERCGSVFQTRKASSNYGIGSDGRVGMYVEEKDRSWASSSKENDNRAVTIEVANSKRGGNWPVSDKALAKLIDLCVDICQRNGIEKLNYNGNKKGNLTMHCYFVPTACPGPYLKSKFPYIAEEVNKRLGVKPEAEKETAKPAVKEEAKVEKPVTTKKAKDSARNFLASLAGTYKVTASALNVRNGAGVTKAKMVAIPKGTAVKCYGYFNYSGSTRWLYIQFTYKGVQYTGFASSKYLKK